MIGLTIAIILCLALVGMIRSILRGQPILRPFHVFPTHAELSEMHPRAMARNDRRYEWFMRRGLSGKILWNTPRVLIGSVVVFGLVMVFHTSATLGEAMHRIFSFLPNIFFFYLIAYFTFLWRIELGVLRFLRSFFGRRSPANAQPQPPSPPQPLPQHQRQWPASRLPTPVAVSRPRQEMRVPRGDWGRN